MARRLNTKLLIAAALFRCSFNSYQKASDAYRELLKLHRNNAAAMNNLAYLLLKHLDKADEAVEVAQRALDIRPNDAMIQDTLGYALFKAGEYDRAREALEASVRKKEMPMNCLHLAEVLLAWGGEEPRATELLNSAKKLAERFNDSETLEEVNQRLESLGQ